jgi:hypothetical protein
VCRGGQSSVLIANVIRVEIKNVGVSQYCGSKVSVPKVCHDISGLHSWNRL